jgi:Acyl carrier protein
MTTFEKLAKIIAECKDLEVSEIKIDSSFKDLELDSLDLAELAMQVEDEFGIAVELNEELTTVNKFVEYIEKAL